MISTASFLLRRAELCTINPVLVSNAAAKTRKTQSKEPVIPTVDAFANLTSISQRMTPFHHVPMSSVGHKRALMKLKRLQRAIQKIRHDAGRFRFLTCQTNGAILKMRVMKDRTGTATASGDKPKLLVPMIAILAVIA